MDILAMVGVVVFVVAMLRTSATGDSVRCLNGEWELQRTRSGDASELHGAWEEVTVPSHLRLTEERYAWYRRQFDVPSEWRGRHLFLAFGGVKFVSDVYVNGRPMGGHFGGWEPFELAVTDACNFDAPNEVLVRVKDVRGVIEGEPEEVPRPGAVGSTRADVLAPVGSRQGPFGIWQDVSLVARNDVYVEDVTVLTSVRTGTLDVRCVLRNLGEAPREVTLRSKVLDGDMTALELGSTSVTVPAGGTADVSLAKPWPDPKLWMPDAPHLYYLESAVTAEDGTQLHVERTRFGFREVWIDGVHFLLNGRRMHFRYASGHPFAGGVNTEEQVREQFEALRACNCTAVRMHANVWPEKWYRIADEVGMPLILESAMFCRNYALDKDEFWATMRDHWQALIRRDKNHPSVVMYSIENEVLHVGGDRFPETEKRLGDLGRFVKSLDPTRPIMYQGDGDPDGAADVINLHYPHELTANWLFPNTCHWVREKTRVGGWPRREWEWTREKPLFIGEFLWAPAMSASVFTAFLGDEAYADYSRGRQLSKAIVWDMQIAAYRADDVTGTCPWTVWEGGRFTPELYEATKRAYHPNAANVNEYDTRFYAGEKVERTVCLYNNTLKPADLVLRWRLGDESRGDQAFSAEAGDRIETTISLLMPDVAECRAVEFELTVENGGEVVFRRALSYQVFPRRAPRLTLGKGVGVAVFERDGQASGFLRSGGVEPLVLDELADLEGADVQVLVVGAHALDAPPDEREEPVVGGGLLPPLASFAEGGGAVLVLEQERPPQAMLPAEFGGRAATMAFRRCGAGGLLDGLDEDAFKFWRGDHLVTHSAMVRPREGAFRVFVDAGGPDGLDKALVLEVPWGDGRYVMSQLLIGEKLGREPMADLMFERLVNYAASAPAPRRAAGLVRGERPLDTDLSVVSAQFDDLTGALATAELAGYDVLVLDASSAEVLAARERLQEFVRGGGRALLHGLDEDDLPALLGALSEGLTLQPNLQTPVLIARRDDEVMAGLTNEDLHWVFDFSGPWGRRHPLSTEVLRGEVTRQLPEMDECTVAEAATMELPETIGEGVQVEGGTIHMWRNGSAAATVTFPQTGRYFLGVAAIGTEVAGTYPEVAVYLDDVQVGRITVNSAEPERFAIIGEAEAGTHALRFSFTNESWHSDRHLYLEQFFFARCSSGPDEALLRPAGLVKIEDGDGFWLLDQVAWDGRASSYDKAARHLSGLLHNLGVAFESRRPWTTISCAPEEAAHVDQSGRETNVASLGPNEAFTAQVRFARGGTHRITATVRGTHQDGEFPLARLLLDGEAAGEGRAQSPWAWHDLSFAAEVSEGVHEVGILFAANGSGEDHRRLSVRRVCISP